MPPRFWGRFKWPELPEWDWQRAIAALQIEQVPYEMISGNVQGYSYARSFAINPCAAFPLKTLFHELGHMVLGHTTDCADGESPCSRGIREFQAEAVAYLLAHELELSEWAPEESRAYIQHWLDGEEFTDRHILPCSPRWTRSWRQVGHAAPRPADSAPRRRPPIACGGTSRSAGHHHPTRHRGGVVVAFVPTGTPRSTDCSGGPTLTEVSRPYLLGPWRFLSNGSSLFHTLFPSA